MFNLNPNLYQYRPNTLVMLVIDTTHKSDITPLPLNHNSKEILCWVCPENCLQTIPPPTAKHRNSMSVISHLFLMPFGQNLKVCFWDHLLVKSKLRTTFTNLGFLIRDSIYEKHRTTRKIQNGCQGFIGYSQQLSLNRFFDPSTPSVRKRARWRKNEDKTWSSVSNST